MAIERVERQEPEGGCLSHRAGLGSGRVMDKDNTGDSIAPLERPDAGIELRAEKPYSIYTLSEKWFIVSMASVAALFR